MKMKIFSMMFVTVVLLASVGGGTWAWFQDTETSANNSLTAGTLDLNVDGGNSEVNTFSLSNVAPGDSGSGSTELSNVGSLDGELDVYLHYVYSTGGTGSTEFEDGVGHLDGNTEMAIFLDVDQSGDWGSGDIGLKYDGTTYAHPAALHYTKMKDYSKVTWDAVETLAAGAADDFIILWQIPGTVGNEIQGDEAHFRITFTLEQAGAD
jgi:spore coat-associated protein N